MGRRPNFIVSQPEAVAGWMRINDSLLTVFVRAPGLCMLLCKRVACGASLDMRFHPFLPG